MEIGEHVDHPDAIITHPHFDVGRWLLGYNSVARDHVIASRFHPESFDEALYHDLRALEGLR